MSDYTEETAEPTKTELYERATELDIHGRSSMDRDELAAAIAEAEGGTAVETTDGGEVLEAQESPARLADEALLAERAKIQDEADAAHAASISGEVPEPVLEDDD